MRRRTCLRMKHSSVAWGRRGAPGLRVKRSSLRRPRAGGTCLRAKHSSGDVGMQRQHQVRA
eukprot:5807837-Alexandrium_andersonii.AAC.1